MLVKESTEKADKRVDPRVKRTRELIVRAFNEELRRRLPDSSGLSEENLKALILAACDYLAGLNTACSRTDQQFKPLIEARVQSELCKLLLGWIEASPATDSRSANV